MNSDLYFNGKKYISARRASQASGYSTDYIGQLCRAKNLECRMIGRGWFVSESSLADYQNSFSKDQEKNSPDSKTVSENVSNIQEIKTGKNEAISSSRDIRDGVDLLNQLVYSADEKPLFPEIKKAENKTDEAAPIESVYNKNDFEPEILSVKNLKIPNRGLKKTLQNATTLLVITAIVSGAFFIKDNPSVKGVYEESFSLAEKFGSKAAGIAGEVKNYFARDGSQEKDYAFRKMSNGKLYGAVTEISADGNSAASSDNLFKKIGGKSKELFFGARNYFSGLFGERNKIAGKEIIPIKQFGKIIADNENESLSWHSPLMLNGRTNAKDFLSVGAKAPSSSLSKPVAYNLKSDITRREVLDLIERFDNNSKSLIYAANAVAGENSLIINQTVSDLKNKISSLEQKETLVPRQLDHVYSSISRSFDEISSLDGVTMTNSSFSGTTGTFTGVFSGASGTFSSGLTVGSQLTVSGIGTSTIAGDVNFDSNTLYVDSVNNRVGIASSSPSETFSLNGAAYLSQISAPSNTIDRLYNSSGDLYWNGNLIGSASVGNWTATSGNVYRASGNIGIGTTSPNWKLSVAGIGSFDDYVRASYFTATSTTASTFPYASTTALTVSGDSWFNGLSAFANLLLSGSTTLQNFTANNSTTTNATTTNFAVSGSAYIGSLNGPLQANSGFVSATTSIGYQYGGTGLTATPSFGQILRGTGSGYALVATSSLGINTTDIIEGSNLFWTNDRFDNRLSATTTLPNLITLANLSITGSQVSNLNTLWDNRMSATTTLSNITTLANLATVGTITSGTWNGSLLSVPYGGTGWSSIQSGSILYGNGSSALSTTTAGTAGNVLAYLNGVPTWTATTSLSTIGGTLNLGTQVSGTLAVSNGGTGQTSFGQGWLNSDGTALSASTSPTVAWMTATSTTATSTFAGGVHIAGQCVTADTRLRRRRRRIKNEEPDEENGEWADDEYIYDTPMIKDIRANDEVRSLDMKSGALMWNKVNGIIYTGIQNIIRITTQSGRSIRTTAVHPYFAHIPRSISPAKPQKLYRFEVDQSIRFDEYARDTFIAVANEEQSFVIKIPKSVKQAFRDALPGTEHKKSLASAMFANAIALLARAKKIKMQEIVIDTEYTGASHERIITAILKGIDPSLEVSFNPVGKKSFAHISAYDAFKGKRDADITGGTDTLFAQMEYIFTGNFSKGKSNNSWNNFETLRPAKSMCGEGGAALTSLRNILWYSNNSATDGIKTENALRTALYGYTTHHSPQAFSSSSSVYNSANLVNEGMWIRADKIKVGHKIAVVHSDDSVWEKVTQIEHLPAESVYDVEIDGTHNFIGNDIVAHNTYIGGNIGIGTTSPNWKLSVAGIGSFDDYARASYFTATSTTASTFPYASTTALTVSGNSYLGTVSSGLWNGTAVGTQYGGTGQNFSASSGLINLYSGTASAMATSSLGLLTTDVAEGSNIYWTDTRFDNRLSATTTLPNLTALANLSITGSQVSNLNTLWDNRMSATTNLPNITTLANLATVGTITSGVWNGTTIAVNKGGTGQTSFGQGWLNSDGTALSASTSPTVNYITATSTTATSTFAGGMNVAGTAGLTVLQNGNVGIGTAEPNYPLDINSASGLSIGKANGSERIKTLSSSLSSPWDILTIASRGNSGGWRGTINLDLSYSNGTPFTAMTLRANTDGTTGNVGIGTTNPGVWKLKTNVGTDQNIGFRSFGGVSQIESINDAGTVDQPLRFDATQYQIMSGNVGIGTTSPYSKLHVVTGSAFNTGVQFATSDFSYGVSGTSINFRTGAATGNTYGIIDVTNGGHGSYGNLTLAPSGGNIGIGTTSPNWKLSVAGIGSFDDYARASYFTATSTTATSTFAGGVDLTSSTGMGLNFGSNTLFYQNNQRFLTSTAGANGNLTIGYQSPTGLDANGGLYNTTLGYQAMQNATSTSYNTAVGYQALKGSATISSVGRNTAVGYQALSNNTTGSYNTANGMQSLYNNITGTYNTANGMQSLYSNTTGYSNTANGMQSLRSNTTGSYNTANGMQSLYNNTTGNYNTANGLNPLYSNTTGAGNVSFGFQAGYGDGTIVDQRSVIDNYMTFIGYQASRDASIASTTALTNGIAIGKNARVGGSNMLVLGGTGADAVSVGIGTTSPTSKLHISDTSTNAINIKLSGLTASAMLDLTSDEPELELYRSGTQKWELISTGRSSVPYFDLEYNDGKLLSINSTGNVGIGTTSPWRTLSVSGTVGLSTTLTDASGTPGSICYNSTTFEMTKNNALSCTVSARDQKHDIEKLTVSGLDTVMQINPVSFKYNDNDNRVRWGFIADELQAVSSQLGDAYDENGNARSIDLPALTSINTKAIQELNLKLISIEASAASSAGTGTDGLFAWIADKFMTAFGIVFSQDKIKTKNIAAENFEMKDGATGETYCVKISNGDWLKTKGVCGETPAVSSSSSSFATSSASSSYSSSAVSSSSSSAVSSSSSSSEASSSGAGSETVSSSSSSSESLSSGSEASSSGEASSSSVSSAVSVSSSSSSTETSSSSAESSSSSESSSAQSSSSSSAVSSSSSSSESSAESSSAPAEQASSSSESSSAESFSVSSEQSSASSVGAE